MANHSAYSPSSSERWLICPGSVGLEAGEPEEAEDFTDRGTRLHAVMEHWLNSDRLDAIRESWLVNDRQFPVITGDIEATADERAVCRRVINELFQLEMIDLTGEVLVRESERFVNHTSIPNIGGTPDLVWMTSDRVMHVHDFKFGEGIAVSAEGNTQLLQYCACLLSHEDAAKIKGFVVYIHQPTRSGEFSSAVVTKKEVRAYEKRIRDAQKSSKLDAGAHCTFCRAKAKCPELARHILEVATFVPPPELDEETKARMIKIFKMASVVKKALSAIAGRLLTEMEQLREVPGYKAVQGYSNRSWTSEDEVIARLKRKKIAKKDYMIEKLKSPTQIEKEGLYDGVKDLVIRNKSTLQLKPISDKGQAVEFDDPTDLLEIVNDIQKDT